MSSDTVLGRPLSFTVPVNVEPGERFGVDCVQVSVYFGDSLVLPNLVRTTVEAAPGQAEGAWLVHVSTNSQVTEPVVQIDVDAGCTRRFTRRFTAFADPPSLPWVGAAAAAGAPSTNVATSPSPTLLPPRGATGGSASGAATRPRGVAHKGPTVALAGLSTPSTPRAGRHRGPVRAEAGAGPAAPGNAGGAPAGTTAALVVPGAPRLVLDAGFAQPRLKMDLDDPVIPPEGAAASAAAELAAQADASTQELQAVQRSIVAARREAMANDLRTRMLREQLARAQERGEWAPYALALAALALAAAGYLGLRLRRQSRLYAHSRWFTESQAPALAAAEAPPEAPAAAPPPYVAEEPEPSVAGEVVDREDPVAQLPNDPGPPVADVAATAPLTNAALVELMAQRPGGEVSAPAPVRELSVEELLDLEQQADFFIALGQEDAAVDLLMSHLRSVGGQSPLPYTKLLEIYRRQDDRAAYERTRARFNRRFNAYAPDWDTGPTAGRTLEDYPETMAQIQSAWLSPIDAMALLEAMLFRRDDASELFDLPAYRDVLLLYSLARDLWQQDGGADSLQVDVLLPLEEDAGYQPFMASTYGAGAAAAQANGRDPAAAEGGAPTAYPSPDYDVLGAPSNYGELQATLELDPRHFEPPAPGKPRGGDPES